MSEKELKKQIIKGMADDLYISSFANVKELMQLDVNVLEKMEKNSAANYAYRIHTHIGHNNVKFSWFNKEDEIEVLLNGLKTLYKKHGYEETLDFILNSDLLEKYRGEFAVDSNAIYLRPSITPNYILLVNKDEFILLEKCKKD